MHLVLFVSFTHNLQVQQACTCTTCNTLCSALIFSFLAFTHYLSQTVTLNPIVVYVMFVSHHAFFQVFLSSSWSTCTYHVCSFLWQRHTIQTIAVTDISPCNHMSIHVQFRSFAPTHTVQVQQLGMCTKCKCFSSHSFHHRIFFCTVSSWFFSHLFHLFIAPILACLKFPSVHQRHADTLFLQVLHTDKQIRIHAFTDLVAFNDTSMHVCTYDMRVRMQFKYTLSAKPLYGIIIACIHIESLIQEHVIEWVSFNQLTCKEQYQYIMQIHMQMHSCICNAKCYDHICMHSTICSFR